MRIPPKGLLASLAVLMWLFAGSPVAAEEFTWIMTSISKAGPVDNGEGHDWTFRPGSDDTWEVEGAQGYTATVSSSGENKVEIRGFPRKWGANGIYAFSKNEDHCSLRSQNSFTHHLKWTCE